MGSSLKDSAKDICTNRKHNFGASGMEIGILCQENHDFHMEISWIHSFRKMLLPMVTNSVLV